MAEDKGMESVDEGMAVVPDAPLADVPTIIPELEGTVSQLATDVSFARKTWKDGSSGGTPITAAELNRLEKGVGDLTNAVNGLRDSVCQLDSDSSTTECTVKLSSGKEIIITAKNKLGQCVSLNCYASEIVIYDEVKNTRIGTYVKTR